ncbi:3-deoxy-D-manno-octulosonate 8-phosphate phosphatase [Indibacter alkaliphilus LW1]|jgi:3-deoxy-D-manno-octulosonate 8-phosphate phosphatase (KDO 8-P phosphatase)|uniref:3-deoxy-D-manno-octulosonate 8-phosphate phosphatase n=2 Tax=Indibacter TaxID=647744 RepID=S2DCW1_INDAL|nr:3-deoxy-D-manno-octulosonate 8-phosphate phosphatase [Indibacter alkaliphilus LW1]
MEEYFKDLNPQIKEKALKIKLLVTDVDGVLTDSGIIYDNSGMEYKRFNAKDGFIVLPLRKNGILVGAISGRKSKVVEDRFEELKFDFHYHGIWDKDKKLREILEVLEISYEEVAYIGDDMIDLPLLDKVGLACCPNDTLPYIKNKADFISSFPGGHGVFREVSDMILHSKGLLVEVIERYTKK